MEIILNKRRYTIDEMNNILERDDLKYFKDILTTVLIDKDDLRKENVDKALKNIEKYGNIIESLIKIGFKKLFKNISTIEIENSSDFLDLENFFDIDLTKKSLWEKIGLSKDLFEIMKTHKTMSLINIGSATVKLMHFKKYKTDDPETLNFLYKCLFKISFNEYETFYNLFNEDNKDMLVKEIKKLYNENNDITICDMLKVLPYYKDYCHMMREMLYKPALLSYNKIRSEHDEVATAHNRFKNSATPRVVQNYITNVYPKLVEFNFSDDEYSIFVPEDINDLITEGQCLHHCVASYIDRFGMGNTTIMFIRKKDQINTPYVTIEISNILTTTPSIVQIRAHHNSDPDRSVMKFVDAWKKEKFQK